MYKKIIIPGNPISRNHAYYFGGKRCFMTKAGKEYKEKASDVFRKHFKEPIKGDVVVSLFFYFGDHRKRDLDNHQKLTIDAMNKIVFDDDSQITKMMLEKSYDKNNPRVEAEIHERND